MPMSIAVPPLRFDIPGRTMQSTPPIMQIPPTAERIERSFIDSAPTCPVKGTPIPPRLVGEVVLQEVKRRIAKTNGAQLTSILKRGQNSIKEFLPRVRLQWIRQWQGATR